MAPMHRTVSKIIAVLLILGTTNAWASDPEELALAQKLFHKGRSLYQAGKFVDAAEKFRAALRIATRPSILLGLAQCYRQLNKTEEALKAYRQYDQLWAKLNPDRSSPYAKEVKSLIASLSQTIKEKEARELQIKEEARQKALAEEKRNAKAKRAAEEKRVAEEKRQASGTPSNGKEAAGTAPPIQNVDADERRTKTLWAYVSLGVGGAAIVTGGILLGVGYAQGNSAYDEYLASGEPTTISLHRSEVDDARPLLTASYVLFGVGAAVLGYSIYQFATRPDETKSVVRAPQGPSISVGQGGGSIFWTGRY
jgi:tetratricopeptide (TPR) repeat protein